MGSRKASVAKPLVEYSMKILSSCWSNVTKIPLDRRTSASMKGGLACWLNSTLLILDTPRWVLLICVHGKLSYIIVACSN